MLKIKKGFDSLSTVELVIYVENKFGVRFGDSEAFELKTVYDLVLLTHQYYSEIRNKQILEELKQEEIVFES